jgi:hypothetical protein
MFHKAYLYASTVTFIMYYTLLGVVPYIKFAFRDFLMSRECPLAK